MGQLLGVLSFDKYDEYVQLNREGNWAVRNDNKLMREGGSVKLLLCGIFIGTSNPKAPELEFVDFMCNWMKTMWDRFASHII
jgi:hypothetical protein